MFFNYVMVARDIFLTLIAIFIKIIPKRESHGAFLAMERF